MRYYNFALYASAEQIRENTTINLREYAYENPIAAVNNYMYKRLDNGSFRWPRSADEAMAITDDQYRMLMQGLEVVARHPITEVAKIPDLM